MKFDCLLFDLDGTLIDSRADLATSINLTLQDLGLDILPEPRVIGFVGEGVRLLVERALQASLARAPKEELVLRALEIYAAHYRAHLLDQTRTYAGVYETLAALEHLPKAVVTNKPIAFTEIILAELELKKYFRAVLGGDSTPERKPAPMPLLEAARQCGVAPENCLMIGDTKIDMEAGKAAGMRTCGFLGGFRGAGELVKAEASFLIENFDDLLKLI